MELSTVGVPTMDMSTKVLRSESVETMSSGTMTQGMDVVHVKECVGPFEEKEMMKGLSLNESLHEGKGEKGRGGGGVGGGIDTMTMTSTLTSTSSMTTVLGAEEKRVKGRIGGGISVMECVSEMIKKKDDRVWGILFSLSPSRVVLCCPPPSAEAMGKGIGVFVSLEEASEEERTAAMRYYGPEMEIGKEEDMKKKSDAEKEKAGVFIFGMLMYEMITGEAPFSGDVEVIAHKKIMNGERPSLEEIENEEIVEIIAKMLKKKIEKRPSLEEAARELRRAIEEEEKEEEEDEEEEEEDTEREWQLGSNWSLY